MRGRPSRAAAAQIAKRRQDALDLRVAGVDIITIAKKLAADRSINSDGTPYQLGYGNDTYEQGQPPPSEEDLGRLVSKNISRALFGAGGRHG